MNKNIIIKSIAALTILTSITGVGTTVVDGIQQTAKAENSVKLITNTNVAPYSGVTWMGAGTGFVVGNHTIITNKHVTYHMKVGDEIKAHPNGFYNNGGGLYKVTKIVDYPGKEDIAVVQVEEKSTQPKGRKFKDFTSKFNIASEAKENEPISVIGYPNPNGNKLQMYESTGKVLSVNGNIVTSDAVVQPGSSGSPILNSKREAIGVMYASNKPTGESTRSFAVYFSPEIKKFIADNLDK
ncbi:TPA: serine protease SplD [Staphylococcus aureus]|uniref:serine protease SplD n=1 Tax=Staphylococcus aureus TaxID=1280 RepID=UPI0020BE401F|nr:serine protease SplD [Staphylococcus aureus]MCR0956025.1 serine protease SplD [Staphylococcus aureus]MCR0958025.1 serine protease SplD [Staphylococcus aureus]MCR0960691.1 serine protease SplD [Staphylococcus aureus]MCR0963793.1 serine protease SplD [Staphylococcus aureus]MCR0966729.1 serine protease SplD [Staphylococcus aureus]